MTDELKAAVELLRFRVYDPDDYCIVFIKGSEFDQSITLVLDALEEAQRQLQQYDAWAGLVVPNEGESDES